MQSRDYHQRWNYVTYKTGVGRQVVFPVLMKPMGRLSKENYEKHGTGNIGTVDNRMPLEGVILRICTDAYTRQEHFLSFTCMLCEDELHLTNIKHEGLLS